MKNRLYLKLYAALLASTFVCLTAAGIAFRLWSRASGTPRERVQGAASAISETVSGVEVPGVREKLAQVASDFSVDVVVGDNRGAKVGVPSVHAFSLPRRLHPGLHRDRSGPTFLVALEDGGWAAIHARGPYRRLTMHPFFAALLVLAVVMAVGSYPVARRVARRLENLAAGVETWGRGQLDQRVSAIGGDEIARLATTFNQAADRVSLVLAQQKQMLANVSHELRSPLARVRMGLELVAEEPEAERRRLGVVEIHRDIVELDALIEEILIFARADARVAGRPLMAVNLAQLCIEEAARTGATFEVAGSASEPTIAGDEALLRHMLRNLLENAEQHGGALSVKIVLAAAPGSDRVVVVVQDEGPGIPEAEREQIFAPFYRRARAPSIGNAISATPASAGSAPSLTTAVTSVATARKTNGHGVGLALVRQVARYHGGEVQYVARVGGGSAFEVTLPRKGPATSAPALPAPAS